MPLSDDGGPVSAIELKGGEADSSWPGRHRLERHGEIGLVNDGRRGRLIAKLGTEMVRLKGLGSCSSPLIWPSSTLFFLGVDDDERHKGSE